MYKNEKKNLNYIAFRFTWTEKVAVQLEKVTKQLLHFFLLHGVGQAQGDEPLEPVLLFHHLDRHLRARTVGS